MTVADCSIISIEAEPKTRVEERKSKQFNVNWAFHLVELLFPEWQQWVAMLSLT